MFNHRVIAKPKGLEFSLKTLRFCFAVITYEFMEILITNFGVSKAQNTF